LIVAFRSAKGNGDYRRLAATAYLKASHLILYANQDKSHLVLVLNRQRHAPKWRCPTKASLCHAAIARSLATTLSKREFDGFAGPSYGHATRRFSLKAPAGCGNIILAMLKTP